MRFREKVAVITGASGGIGEAYAKGLAEEGARIVVADIEREGGERVAREISDAGGWAIVVETDVADEASTQAMAGAAAEAYGGVDYLVNNAAIYGDMKIAGLLGVDMDYYRRFMDVNMNGCLLATRAVVGSMTDRGGGAIVNQSSTAAWMGIGFYGIAKLAMHGLTHSLARELGPRNIRINAIAPGPTDTEATRRQVHSSILDGILSQMPLRRMGEPADMVGALKFLLSDDARWITGHVLNVDGGQVMRV
jgi:NAD(P)-dependent dehydrogenase (short-subunit alcohol dehydrogenase family)